MQKQDCTTYDEKIAAILTSRKQDWRFTLVIHWSSQKLAKIFFGITTKPHHVDPKQMGIGERGGVRSVKEGTSTLLAPSGWDEHWQGEASECYCYVRHIQDLLADGKTLHERSCDTPFRGQIRPFGSVMWRETQSYLLIFRGTAIVICAHAQKSRELQAEEMQNVEKTEDHKQRDLGTITADQKVFDGENKSRMQH